MNYSIVAKYIKDINFNIPDAKSFFLIEKNIGKYRINFDIKSQKLKDGVVEIDTNLKLLSDGEDENKITVSILYSSLINLKQDVKDKKELEKIILVDVPKSIYPDIRDLIIFLFKKSGFKKINIEENIDFQKLYEKRN
tara:strand:+ start:445 stop:858 length:414 start_codon:yes stop_codon:yes gene_type:complete